MHIRYIFLLLIACTCLRSEAQMVNGVDTLYGNEWIDYAKTYYRIKVPSDGIYRVNYTQLQTAGIPIGSTNAQDFRLYCCGKQVPIFTSAAGPLGASDFIEFYGERNKQTIDRYLFSDPDGQNLNPWYSLFNDTAVYYLCIQPATPALRYTAVSNNLSNLPVKEPFCWYTDLQYFNSDFFKRGIGSDVTYSWFNGDGFGYSNTNQSQVTSSPKHLYTAGPAATASIRFGCNLGSHQIQIHLADSLYYDTAFTDFTILTRKFTIPLSKLNSDLVVKIDALNGLYDRQIVSGISLRYPRSFNFDNAGSACFELPASAVGQYLEISGINAGGGNPVLYDLTNNLRIETTLESNLIKVFLPPSTQARKILLSGISTGMLQPQALTSVQFHNYTADNLGYIILSTPSLFHDKQAAGANQVQAYADYRASVPGGHYKSKVINVEELYEQFAYGIRFHPIAIRNFSSFAKKHWPAIQDMLLVGKGLDYNAFRTSDQQHTLADSLFFIPDYGAPGADMLYVMGGNVITKPLFPVGRLAVTKPSQVRDYLDKVIEQEQVLAGAQQTIADRAWMKRFLHISGGLPPEQPLIKSQVQTMTDEITNNLIGAEVQTLYKTSNDPIQITPLDQVLNAVNGGVNTWMIFGHSSAFGVDFDIGSIDIYHNKGKYPFIMIMGCFSGICSNNIPGLGESFLLARDKGAIAYLAPVNFSFVDALGSFGLRMYQNMGGADYGKTLGETILHSIGSFGPTSYIQLIAVLHQIQLQGDPAIHLHSIQGPDYTFDPASVVVNPNPVSIDLNTYDFDVQLLNIGKNTGGKIGVRISQDWTNNTTRILKIDSVDAPANRRLLHYSLPAADNKVGFSRIYAEVDPANKIAETPSGAEFNNDLKDAAGQKGVQVYFYSGDVQPSWPPNFSIVGHAPVKLYASSLALKNNLVRYKFEMDTIESFDSPFLKKATLFQQSGLLNWTPAVTYKDSTVYYWRVAKDTLVNNNTLWHSSSFLYLKDSPAGWNQSDFGQFVQDEFTTTQWKDRHHRLEFSDEGQQFEFRAGYLGSQFSPGVYDNFGTGYITPYWWGTQSIERGVAVFQVNPNSGRLIYNPPGGDNNPTPTAPSLVHYFDTRDSLSRKALMNFLQNGLYPGAYVSLVTVDRYSDPIGYAPQKWAQDSVLFGKNLFQVMEQLGAKHVRQLAGGANPPPAYGFTFKQGAVPAQAFDTLTTLIDPPYFDTHRKYLAHWYTGNLQSKIIGPAKSWTAVHWKKGPTDNIDDKACLAVLGVRDNKPDTLLFKLNNTLDTSLAWLSAAQFPYLKVRYEAMDTFARTATQIRYARVVYQGVPEGAIHPAFKYTFYADTLQQGDSLKMSIGFANISNLPMDSLLVRFKMESGSNGASVSRLQKFKPLAPGDSVLLSVRMSTKLSEGKQRFTVEANPDNNQPEQYHFNNIAFRDFFVAKDNRNPLLDVTFDGYHIMNGDLISPKPEVVMILKDDNRFLPMTDTSTFMLHLQSPDGSLRPVYFSDPSIRFFPADPASLPKKNQAKLEWRPAFVKDGEYRLLVNGKDASGNASAVLDYAISFKVITVSSISNLLNYPNPFSTSTCFVYTLTGSESPANFRLQIMTVSGRVVRDVTESEFGPLHAGTHQSSFCWDGKDQYGDRLANGVYLYRMLARKADGSNFEFFTNDKIDGYFKHGIGKIVLMH